MHDERGSGDEQVFEERVAYGSTRVYANLLSFTVVENVSFRRILLTRHSSTRTFDSLAVILVCKPSVITEQTRRVLDANVRREYDRKAYNFEGWSGYTLKPSYFKYYLPVSSVSSAASSSALASINSASLYINLPRSEPGQ